MLQTIKTYFTTYKMGTPVKKKKSKKKKKKKVKNRKVSVSIKRDWFGSKSIINARGTSDI